MYQDALQTYPNMREPARILEAEEQARFRRQRDGFARMVHRRRRLRLIIEALRGSGVALATPGSTAQANNAGLEAAFHAWHAQQMRAAELRREEEDRRARTTGCVEAWLAKRKARMDQVRPRLDVDLLVYRNLSQRGPLKLAKKSRLVPPPNQRLHTRSYYSVMEDSDSPYMSPCPAWSRTPQSARSRRLPPLQEQDSAFAIGGANRSDIKLPKLQTTSSANS